MDYKKLEELAHSQLDGEKLSAEETQAVNDALKTNDKLRFEVAALRSTKRAISQHADSLRVETPREVRINILETIRNEARAGARAEAAQAADKPDGIRAFFASLFGQHRMALAGGLVLVVAIIYFFAPAPQDLPSDGRIALGSAQPVDFMADVVKVFHKVEKTGGKIAAEHPAITPNSEEELHAFFSKNGVDFSTWETRPEVQIVGAYVTIMEGEPIGHVIYRDERNAILCLCQVPRTLFERNCLKLADSVMGEINGHGRFETSVDNDVTVAMRCNGASITTVVASLSTPIFE